MKQRGTLAALLAVMAFCLVAGAEERPLPIAVVFSAQSQGALFACRCPFNPEGGLARRATVINELSASYDLVVVEAGGWMPGGVYDEFNGGADELRARASLVTDLMRTGGTAVTALAADDLATGLPAVRSLSPPGLLEGNLADAPEPRYAMHKGIAFVSVHEPSFPSGLYSREGVTVTDPTSHVTCATEAARKAGAKTVVLISSGEEEWTVRLLATLKGIDAAFVSSRSVGRRVPYRAGSTLVMALEPLGKAVGVYEPGKGFREIRLSAASVQPDALVAEKIAARGYTGDALDKVTLDLYTMSRCPYGRPALAQLLQAASDLHTRVTLNIWFVVSTDDKGKLHSLHGEDELEENRRILAVLLNKPAALADYLKKAGAEDFDFGQWLNAAGIDPWRVKGALDSGEIDAELLSHAARCKALGVTASPTLFVAGEHYQGPFERERLLFAICNRLKGARELPVCSSLPECFSDLDCFKPGFVSVCEKPGTKDARCVHYEDAPLQVTLIRATGAVADPADAALEGLRRWLPSMQVTEIAENSAIASSLISKAKITHLPALVFSPALKDMRNYAKIKDGFREFSGGFIANPAAYSANTLTALPRTPGTRQLFISAAGPLSREVVLRLEMLWERGVRFPPPSFTLYPSPDTFAPVARGGLRELEEAARMRSAYLYGDEKGWKYLFERARAWDSGYWEDAAVAAGIDPAGLKEMARGITLSVLRADAKVVEQLGIGSEVFFLCNGREVVVPVDAFDFEVLSWRLNEGQ